jgi:hypothetical protein
MEQREVFAKRCTCRQCGVFLCYIEHPQDVVVQLLSVSGRASRPKTWCSACALILGIPEDARLGGYKVIEQPENTTDGK